MADEQVVVETKVAASAVEAWDVTRLPTVSARRCGVFIAAPMA